MSRKKNNDFSYETAISRLESILNDIQQGKIPLDQFEATLKEARELFLSSRKYLRSLDDSIREMEEGE